MPEPFRRHASHSAAAPSDYGITYLPPRAAGRGDALTSRYFIVASYRYAMRLQLSSVTDRHRRSMLTALPEGSASAQKCYTGTALLSCNACRSPQFICGASPLSLLFDEPVSMPPASPFLIGIVSYESHSRNAKYPC